jgi:hypothetical protein
MPIWSRVAAYISRPKYWRAWTKDWNKAKKPIKVFHATDCATFHGEFDGWTKERRDPYVANLLPIIPAHEMAGVVIGVQLKDLAAEMKECAELIEMFGTPYTACFPMGDFHHHGDCHRTRKRRAHGLRP